MREDARPWAVRPHILDVMWCRFPYHGEGGRPANDKHPVLCCQTAEDSTGLWWVACYYGTSKMRLADREEVDLIVMNPDNIAAMALRTATRFQLDRCMWLPFTDEYFIENPASVGSPRFARAPEQVKAQLIAKLKYREALGFHAYPKTPVPRIPPYVPDGTKGPDS